MFSQPLKVSFQLPDWISDFSRSYISTTDNTEQMKFILSAARMNVEQGTGGPFAAGIFEIESGMLVSLGVNLVTSQGLSMLHAEMVAIALAQRKLNTYDLGGPQLPAHELVTSVEPCAMCFGAVIWSGVSQLVTGARTSDAVAIGFDEGLKPDGWTAALNGRGVRVSANIERESARDVLQLYLDNNGRIYNSREGG
jgi:tRNA(Arg) A34 adenosine deaminase TadA